MKTKRILSLLLASCLIMAMFVSCKGNDEDPSGTVTTTTTVSSGDDGIFELDPDFFGESSTTTQSNIQSGASTTVTTQKTYAKVDNDEEFKKLPQYIQDTYKLLPDLKTDSEKKVTIMFHGDLGNSRLLGYKYGITAEAMVVPWAESITTYVSKVNAGTGPDILVQNYNYTMISKKYVQAWDDYVNLSDPMWTAEKEIMSNFQVGGKTYLFIPKDPTKSYHVGYVLFNRDMIKNAGLQTPDELYAAGKWDWNAFINIADKLTNTTNKTYGAWLYNGPMMFVASTGHDYIQFVNGRAKNMINDADTSRAIAAYSDLVANKSLYYGGNAEVLVTRGQVAMAVTTTGGVMAAEDQILKGTCGVAAFPRDPQSKEHCMLYEANGFYLAKGAKHPNNAAAWLAVWHYEHSTEYLRNQNNQLLLENEGKGTNKEIYEQFEKINTSVDGAMWTWAMFSNDYVTYVSAIGSALEAGEPWSKIAAELSPIANAAINAFYGG